MEKILNEKDIHQILNNFIQNTNFEFISSKILSHSNNIEGFMGDYFLIEIKFHQQNEVKNEHFFIKCTPTNSEYQKNAALERNLYGKEIFFYNFLMKEYEKYSLDTSFAPKCYLSKENQFLVLENLNKKQFILSEKLILYDLDQCKTGLQALALYHSSSMLYEEMKSRELGEIFRLNEKYPELFMENYYNLTSKSSFSSDIIKSNITDIKYKIEQMQDKIKFDENFKNCLSPEYILSCFKSKSHLRQATGHGDLWSNNIFFKYENKKAVKCKIVDFQTLRYFHPVYDVLIFIYINTNQKFRKLHLSHLLKYYYDNLCDIFTKHGFNIDDTFSLNDFNESLRLVEMAAMFNVHGIGSLVFMTEDMLREIFEANVNTNMIHKHFEVSCKGFVNNQNYRQRMIEAFDDFYQSYLKRIEKNDLLI